MPLVTRAHNRCSNSKSKRRETTDRESTWICKTCSIAEASASTTKMWPTRLQSALTWSTRTLESPSTWKRTPTTETVFSRQDPPTRRRTRPASTCVTSREVHHSSRADMEPKARSPLAHSSLPPGWLMRQTAQAEHVWMSARRCQIDTQWATKSKDQLQAAPISCLPSRNKRPLWAPTSALEPTC